MQFYVTDYEYLLFWDMFGVQSPAQCQYTASLERLIFSMGVNDWLLFKLRIPHTFLRTADSSDICVRETQKVYKEWHLKKEGGIEIR